MRYKIESSQNSMPLNDATNVGVPYLRTQNTADSHLVGRWECRDDHHFKYWQLKPEKNGFTVEYGSISDPIPRRGGWLTYEEAVVKVRGKLRKGYARRTPVEDALVNQEFLGLQARKIKESAVKAQVKKPAQQETMVAETSCAVIPARRSRL